jgi:hypothetical protein
VTSEGGLTKFSFPLVRVYLAVSHITPPIDSLILIRKASCINSIDERPNRVGSRSS